MSTEASHDTASEHGSGTVEFGPRIGARDYDKDADRAIWGDDQGYVAPPRFSIHPDPSERLVYEAQSHADSARIYAERLSAQLDTLFGRQIPTQQLEGLKNAARDCELAINDAIAKLSRAA